MAAGFQQFGGIATQIAGGVTRALGQQRAADAQARASEAQAAAFQANAAISQQNAAAASRAAEISKSRQERIGKARLASRSTQFLKGGVALSGSPLAVLGEEAVNEALAAEDAAFEQRTRAVQQQNQATLQRFFAGQALSKASGIREEGRFRSGSTLLGTT